MSRKDTERLLTRWSRLKRESAAGGGNDAKTPQQGTTGTRHDTSGGPSVGPDSVPTDEPLPKLPSIDELDADSDFQAFMDPRVDDDVRRAALKKLFRNPDFNICDGLDVYAEDYTKLEKLTPVMVAALRYAQRTLFDKQDESDSEAVLADATQKADTITASADDHAAGVPGVARTHEKRERTVAPESDVTGHAPNQLAVSDSEAPYPASEQLPQQLKKR